MGIFNTQFHPHRSGNMEITGGTEMSLPRFLGKLTIFFIAKNLYRVSYEVTTKDLVADSRLQADRRTDGRTWYRIGNPLFTS